MNVIRFSLVILSGEMIQLFKWNGLHRLYSVSEGDLTDTLAQTCFENKIEYQISKFKAYQLVSNKA